jgi:hypothetical protein
MIFMAWLNALLVPFGVMFDVRWEIVATNGFVALFLQIDAIRTKRG